MDFTWCGIVLAWEKGGGGSIFKSGQQEKQKKEQETEKEKEGRQ